MPKPMQFVSKSAPDIPRQYLTPDQTGLLHHYWNTPSPDRSEAMLKEVGQLLRQAIDHKFWIRCGCGTGAMMYPSELHATGSIRLTRMSSYPAHEEGCSFSWEEGELGANSGVGELDNKARKLPEMPAFALYKAAQPVASGGSGSIPSGGSMKKRERRSKLQTLLFWLLKEAGMDYLGGKASPSFQHIKAVAEQVDLVPGVKLTTVFWFSQRAISEGWSADRFRRLVASEQWPKNWPAQGFLLLVVSSYSVTENSIALADGLTVKIEGALEVFGRGGAAGAPYLALVSMRGEAGRIKFVGAYLHPVLAGQEWLCVDSSLERDAVEVIKAFVAGAAKQGIKYRVQKPLEDIEVGDEGCRPDFLISDSHGRRLLVETMGSSDEVYLRRKHGTHGLMANLGRLVLDERAKMTRDVADEALRKALWRWHFDRERK